MGSLEDDVMAWLWAVSAPSCASAVLQAVGPELAYTTVNTVLTRLWEKGRVERTRQGRSFVYAPVRSEAEHRADTMATELGAAADRAAVLSSFLEGLAKPDLEVLRNLLEDES